MVLEENSGILGLKYAVTMETFKWKGDITKSLFILFMMYECVLCYYYNLMSLFLLLCKYW